MRLRWLSLIPLFFAFTCSANKSAQPLCEPGTEIFCRCRGGAPGTKLCGEAGDGFGECRLSDGECTEIPEPTTSTSATVGVGGASSTGVGGSGGAPACSHDLCEPGDPLVPGCDPCVTELCTTVDPYCCNKLQGQMGIWDEMCVSEAIKACGLECAVPSGSSSSGSTSMSSSSGGPQCFGMDVLFPGDVIITEFMNDSSAIADTQGEWFELYNTQSECIDLKGVVIVSANDSKPHVIAQTTILEPKSYIVVCKDKATLASIGVSCAYSVGGAINLGNSSDTLELTTPNGLIDGIAYTSTFIHPIGASRALDSTKIDHKSNDSELNWCVSTSFIAGSSGDRGTPGKANDPCN